MSNESAETRDLGVAFAFKEQGARLSNWGRWGPNDMAGTVNFITDEARRDAAHLIKRGRVFDLGLPFVPDGPQINAGRGRFNAIHKMLQLPTDVPRSDGFASSDDMVIMPLQCATQWDGLAHVGYDGFFYNGVPFSSVTARSGASVNGFEKVVAQLVGRGVLLDIAGLRGVDCLAFGDEITAADLEQATLRQGVSIRSGDIVLVRTGWHNHYARMDYASYMSPNEAGLGVSACDWLYENEVAAVASDNYAVEVRPATEAGASLPVHSILIRDLGMTLGEMFNLEDLARDCSDDGIWEFFFSGIGIKIPNAVGSPVTPVVLK